MLHPMYKYIEESNLIEGITDPKEIKQSIHAWEILIDNWPYRLTHDAICKVQKIITINQSNLRPDQRGYYRDMSQVNVRVGDYTAPDWPYVMAMMVEWVRDYVLYTPWHNHMRFEKIHPFVDGNGRTGRMLMWWQEVTSGQEPTLIKASERFDYYKKLNDYKEK